MLSNLTDRAKKTADRVRGKHADDDDDNAAQNAEVTPAPEPALSADESSSSSSEGKSFSDRAREKAAAAAAKTRAAAATAAAKTQQLAAAAAEEAEELVDRAAETEAGKRAAAAAAEAEKRARNAAAAAAKTEAGKAARKAADRAATSADRAKAQAKAKVKNAKAELRRKLVNAACKAAESGVNKAVDNVGASMGKDPYMPRAVVSAVDVVLNDIKGDANILIREAIEDIIEKKDKEVAAKITKTYHPCCRPYPWTWLRAIVLYTMTPNDRSIWWQLRQPMWWLLTVISVFPSYGVSQVWWVLLFFLRDFRDEFQLVSFMVKVKTVAVISVGLLPAFIGIFQYVICTQRGTCNTEGPGLQTNFVFQTAFLSVQALLVYLAAILVPCSEDKGRRVRKTDQTNSTTQEGDSRAHSRLRWWLVYDLLTVVGCTAAFILSWLSYKETENDAKKAAGFLKNQTAYELAEELDKALVVGNALFHARVYWIRVAYGMLCMPWWIFKAPLMLSLLLHTHATAYNRQGETVPFANAGEKEETYGHRCCKCSDDSVEARQAQMEYYRKENERTKAERDALKPMSFEVENPAAGQGKHGF